MQKNYNMRPIFKHWLHISVKYFNNEENTTLEHKKFKKKHASKHQQLSKNRVKLQKLKKAWTSARSKVSLKTSTYVHSCVRQTNS